MNRLIKMKSYSSCRGKEGKMTSLITGLGVRGEHYTSDFLLIPLTDLSKILIRLEIC